MEKQSHILVVDDNADLCANLRKILGMHDYAVDIACNANDAIALCRKTHYDIALVDIQLGAMSGHELVEKMAQLSPAIDCIFMTAYASLESALEAVKQAHVVSYETKPLDLDRLLAIIKQVIKRKQAEELRDKTLENLRQTEEKLYLHNEELQHANEELLMIQQQLEASRQRYVDLYDFAPLGYYSFDLDGVIVEANRTAAWQIGYARETLIKTRFHHYIADEHDQDTFYLHLRTLFQTHIRQVCEIGLVRQDGSRFPAQLESVVFQDYPGNVHHCRTTISDITARKQAEHEIKEINQRMTLAADSAGLGVWDADLIKNELMWDDWMFRLFDVEPKDFKGGLKDWERYVHPDDLDRVAEEAELAVRGEKDIDTDYRIVQPSGAVRHIRVFAVVVRDSDGHPIRITGTAQDITARRQTEEALRVSEKRFRSFFEHSPISLWEEDYSQVIGYVDELRDSGIHDLRVYFDDHPEEIVKCAGLVRILDVNPATLKIYDAQSKDDLFRNLNDVFAEESLDVFKEQIISFSEGRFDLQREGITQTLTGRKNTINIMISLLSDWHVLVSIIDITERKRTEEALRESEKLLREAQLIGKLGHWMWDREADTLMWSDEVYRIFGVQPGSFHPSAEAFEATIHPDDVEEFLSQREVMLREHHKAYIEYRIIRPDGDIRYVVERTELKLDDEGNVRRVIGTVQDITKRNRMEEALRESEEKLQSLFITMAEGVVMIAPDGQIVQANPAAERILGLKQTVIETRSYIAPEWKIFRPDGTPMPPEEMAGPRVITERRPVKNVVMGVKRLDGSITWLNVSAVPLINEAGVFNGVVGTFADITERKQAEEQIKASLKEKEVLLQEIHHRVKNNLQIISSLLDLSRLRTRDQQAIDLLTDARARIHSMAMIHTQLYQSKQFEQIDMEHQIHDLVSYLSAVYAERKMVTPRVEASGVCLSLIQAIPCALILNELIANAFKHAFKEGRAGTLEISMQQSPENTIVLNVKDNGIGIRDDIDLEHTNTLGLKLVRILVQQLRGELQVIRDMGTECMITFDI